MESPPRGFLFLVGLKAHFCLEGAAGAPRNVAIVTANLRERLITLIEPLLQRLGYESLPQDPRHDCFTPGGARGAPPNKNGP